MKIIHKNIKEHLSHAELLSNARELEKTDIKAAINIYEKYLKERPLSEFVYNRLMILYRRNKEYKKELKVIITAIKTFERQYNKTKKRSTNNMIAKLSRSLIKSTGLSDKKGNLLYQPEPIGKWTTRLNILKKKYKQL